MSDIPSTAIAYLRVTVGPQPEYVRYRGFELADDTVQISSGKKLKIGRNPIEVDLQVYELAANCAISRLHCSIEYDPTTGKFMLCDEGSTNGTYIGDERLEVGTPVALNEGDLITLGSAKHNGVQFAFTTLEKSQHEPLERIVLRPFVDEEEEEVAAKPDTPDKVAEDEALFEAIGAEAQPAPEIKEAEEIEEQSVKVQVSTKIINKYDVFLSYSPDDMETMKKIRSYLMNRAQLHIWLDDALEHGTRTRQQIIKNVLINSHCVVALISPAINDTKAFQKELAYAKSNKSRVIPVMIDSGGKPNQLSLPGIKFVDLRGDKLDSNLQELAEKIQSRIKDLKEPGN